MISLTFSRVSNNPQTRVFGGLRVSDGFLDEMDPSTYRSIKYENVLRELEIMDFHQNFPKISHFFEKIKFARPVAAF